MSAHPTVAKLLRQQAALAAFGSFAFAERDPEAVLAEAARACAESLGAPFAKICRYRPEQNDLLVVAGYGWSPGVIGCVVSRADETSTQGRAFVTGQPVILDDVRINTSYQLPAFYAEYGILSTVDVLIQGGEGPFGVLEVDCTVQHTFDDHDVIFLTGFANVVAEAASKAERWGALQSALVQVQKLADEKDILASELQHRVRNNLQLVYGMLIRQIELPEKEAQAGAQAIARRVMSLSRIYDHLLGRGLVQTINFGSYLDSLCKSLEDFQQRGFPFEIKIVCEAEPITLGLDLVTALGISVTEIVSNAYLHAFPAGNGTIRVNLAHHHGGGRLTISDDGVGFVPQAVSKRHGVGLVRRLIEQEEGTAELMSYPGTTWRLSFPVPAERSDDVPVVH